MTKKLLLPLIAICLYSCGGEENTKSQVAENSSQEEALEQKMSYYGEEITEEGAVSPEEFLLKMEGEDTVQVKLKATINQTCVKKGCWMDVDLGTGKEMTVRFKDYGFFVPTEGEEGKTAVFEGIAFQDTVPVALLQHYAEDAGKSQEEIEAITEPEITIGFEAVGVIIKDE